MNLFQNVKYGVNCREAAERYGVSVNRQGKALCPFHNDRRPSLYVTDDHYYCFACGAHGDVIDFAANFFDLPLYEAAQRLAADFGINTDRPPTKEILEKRRQRTEYYLDILCAGDSHERAEVVNYLLADGRLDKFKEIINGRDAAWTRSMPVWIFQYGSMARTSTKRLFAGNFYQRTSSSMRTTHFLHRTDG